MTIIIRYEVILYWSDEDDAPANVEVIIQEWIDTVRALGWPIPEPKGRLNYA